MADNSETKESAGKSKVGDILMKARLTRRIMVETIAKDLKLNVGYIKALEASDYDSLPPDPYVRVYIRSLTKYLSLDADSILTAFYRERGLITDEPAQNQSGKIDVSVQRQDKNQTTIAVAIVIVVLMVFAFVAVKKGWVTQQPVDTASAVEKPDTNAAAPDHDAESQKIADSILETQNAAIQNESKPPATVANPTKQAVRKQQPPGL
jgi:cytoskeleton protein RodZ